MLFRSRMCRHNITANKAVALGKVKYTHRAMLAEVKEASIKSGISVAAIWQRMEDKRISIVEAVSIGKPYTRMTQDKAVRLCAKHMCMSHHTIYARMYTKGMTLEEAVRMGDNKSDGIKREFRAA